METSATVVLALCVVLFAYLGWRLQQPAYPTLLILAIVFLPVGNRTFFPSLDFRPIIPVLALIALVTVPRGKVSTIGRRWILVVASMTVAGIVSLLWSSNFASTLQSSYGMFATLAVCATGAAVAERFRAKIRRDVSAFLFAILAASVVAAIVGLTGALAGGRARGILQNANGLGLVALLSLALMLPNRKLRTLVLPLALAALLLSGSRSAAIASVAILLVFVFTRSNSARDWAKSHVVRGALVIFLVLGVLWVWGDSTAKESVQAPSSSILRTSDSRTEYWSDAITKILQEPILGTGLGASTGYVVNSYLTIVVELGFAGLSIIVLWIWFVLKSWSKLDEASRLVIVGASISGFFESWLASGGSFYFISLSLIIVSHSHATNSIIACADSGIETNELN